MKPNKNTGERVQAATPYACRYCGRNVEYCGLGSYACAVCSGPLGPEPEPAGFPMRFLLGLADLRENWRQDEGRVVAAAQTVVAELMAKIGCSSTTPNFTVSGFVRDMTPLAQMTDTEQAKFLQSARMYPPNENSRIGAAGFMLRRDVTINDACETVALRIRSVLGLLRLLAREGGGDAGAWNGCLFILEEAQRLHEVAHGLILRQGAAVDGLDSGAVDNCETVRSHLLSVRGILFLLTGGDCEEPDAAVACLALVEEACGLHELVNEAAGASRAP